MARGIHRLTPSRIERRRRPGLFADGGGLYLQVMPGGSRSWIFQFDRAGKRTKLGLGPLHTVSLDQARKRARALREQLLCGAVPASARAVQRPSITFRKVMAEYLAAHRAGWRSGQGALNVERSLTQHVLPVLGDLAVDKIELEDVFRALAPIWHTRTPTATLLRTRIEQILDFAKACKYRAGENPAAWKGNLAHRLPSRAKLHRPEPQPALPYQQLPEFMQHLRSVPGIPSLALQFLILTATRTGDLVGGDRQNPRPMLWGHIDVADALWVIPRGKNNQRHQVPLSGPALRILEDLKLARDPASDIVFPGDKPGTIMAIGAMRQVIARMNAARQRDGKPLYLDPTSGKVITAHGTARAGFKTWAEECSTAKSVVIESCLSHVVPEALERAYRRSDFISQRRALMSQWADFLQDGAQFGTVLNFPSSA
jgi:integrase